MSLVVKLSWYERFLNNLNKTNLYAGRGKNYKPEREEALKTFLKDMEYDVYVEGYRDGMRGDDPRLWNEEEDGIGS